MSTLLAFDDWVLSTGRTSGTADLYEYHVRYAFDVGISDRLTDSRLAPKTRRAAKASLQAYANFLEDPDGGDDAEEASQLRRRLKKMRLPPPDRKQERPALPRESWLRLRREAEDADYLDGPERAVLGMLMSRGFRVGDILRMTRKEVEDSLTNDFVYFVAKGRKHLKYPIKRFRHHLETLTDYDDWGTIAELLSPHAGKPHKAAYQRVRRAVREVAYQAGLDPNDMYTHLFRRTYAAEFLKRAEFDLTKLKTHMGWADIGVAASYVDAHQLDELEDLADDI